MGIQCLGTRIKEESPDGMPSAPPGFAPQKSITLKKDNDNGDVGKISAATLNAPDSTKCNVEHQTPEKCSQGLEKSGTAGFETSRKSLRQRTWVNYKQFDISSDEESDYELAELVRSTRTRSLPKGVIRGCIECPNCQKVTARWRPQESRRPILDEAPVFYPSEEEFKDTLVYIASIRPKAEQYGICRIVPPSSWKPSCVLKEKHLWEKSEFTTRIQQVDKLQNRDSGKKNQDIMRRKRRKILTVDNNGSDENGGQVSQLKYGDSSERFGFIPGPDFTLDAFQKYADEFKKQYFHTNTNADLRSISVENIEGEYWRIVERPTEEIEVLYGADLETSAFGSGFPKASSSLEKSEYEDQYVSSGWNLNNFPRLSGSVLCYEGGDISGVLVPWLYVGMCFSSFCWHVEDHHLYSLNYLHWGAPKMWYGVPGKDASKLEEAMKKHLPNLFEEQPDLLHNLVTQFSPSSLKLEGVPVYRCVQNAGEFVLTFPRAYHSGFNCGFNCAEAVNVAPIDWLPHGQNAVELYREQGRKISISHDKLLLGAAREAVRAQWNIQFLRNNSPDNLRWKAFCGADGILTKALKVRIEMERLRREHLSSSQTRKMDAGFDANCERECIICHYDLHLSAASCPCSPDRFACPVHAKQMCACDKSSQLFILRYDINELNVLLDALMGKLSAVHRWGLSDLRLTLSSHVTKEKSQDCKSADTSNKEGKAQKDNGSSASTTGHARYSSSKESNVLMSQKPPAIAPKEKEITSNAADTAYKSSTQCSPQQVISLATSVLNEPPKTSKQICSDMTNHLPSSKETKNPILSSSNKTTFSFETKHLLTSVSPATELDKSSSSAERKTVLLCDSEHKGINRVASNRNSEANYRLVSCDDKAISSNIHNDQPLHTPQTNATSLTEKDISMLPVLETTIDSSNLKVVDEKGQGGGICENSSMYIASVGHSPPKIMENVKPISLTMSRSVSQASNSKSAGSGSYSTHLSGNTTNQNNASYEEKVNLDSEAIPADRGNSVPASPSCTHHILDRYNRQQKGPRTAKVVRRINCNVEAMEYGVVLSGKLWSTSQAIFPKGYRSRVRYFSVLDPTQSCSYISEILDAGLLRPLFMVVVEQCPSEVFIHVSPARCWDMVRERVNNEIRKHHNMGRLNLPSLQPPGSIDGLEMFGLSSPLVIQAIEALDSNHVCTDYWRSRPKAVLALEAPNQSKETLQEHVLPADSNTVLLGLLKKASPDELQALHTLITNDAQQNSIQELSLLLNKEIGNLRHG